MLEIALYIVSFFLGSIPFGVIAGKIKGVDIRKVGSGNIGATNVNRALGSKWAIGVFLLDVLKSFLPALLVPIILKNGGQLFPIAVADTGVLAGISAIMGHLFSPFVGFKGGKGIASGLGALLGTNPLLGILAFSVFVVMMLFTRIVSLSSIIAAPSIIVFALVFHQTLIYTIVFGGMAVFILIKHIPNMKRLMKGEESKFSFDFKKRENEPVASDVESEQKKDG